MLEQASTKTAKSVFDVAAMGNRKTATMGDLQLDGLTLINGVYHLTYQGLTLSLSSWAQKRGMSQGMLKERTRAGWPVAQALGYEDRVRPKVDYEARRRQLTCNGRTQSLAKWSEERKLNPARIAMRIANGWPMEQALGFVPRQRKKKPRTNQLTDFVGLTVVTRTVELIDRKAMGKQAREIRSKAGKTLREAAQQMGTTISGMNHLETGRRKWTTELIDRFNAVAAGWVVQNEQTND